MRILRATAALQLLLSSSRVDATSIKMDYLPSGFARVDPILSTTCPSDHVHTFYGPQSGVDPRRINDSDQLELHAKLLATPVGENTGVVEENKSLYWHPTVYKYDQGSGTYTRAAMAQSTAYYVWDTGMTRAFPNGFRMIAGFDVEKSGATAECVNPSPCQGDCYTENSFFPATRCEELEVSMRMPSCWDGTSLSSPPDHTGHVAYPNDGDCPSSHPVRIPRIELFFRIMPYSGGWHTFSDGSSVFHSDYVSGWDETFLQELLDGCDNEGDGAMPNFFCEDFLTYRDAPKCTDEDTCDFSDPRLLEKLRAVQPATPLDVKGTIIAEETEVVQSLPRGTCNGSLVGGQPVTPPPTPNQATPDPTRQPTPNPTPRPTPKPTPSSGGPCAGSVVEGHDFESGDYSGSIEGVRRRNGNEYPVRAPWARRTYGPAVCGEGWSLVAGQMNNGRRKGVDDETWFTLNVPEGAGSFDFKYNRNKLDENFDRFEVFVNGDVVHSYQGGNSPNFAECELATCVTVEPGDEIDFLCRSRGNNEWCSIDDLKFYSSAPTLLAGLNDAKDAGKDADKDAAEDEIFHIQPLDLAEEVVAACDPYQLKAGGRAGCEELCSGRLCCFEEGGGSCLDDACIEYAGCAALLEDYD